MISIYSISLGCPKNRVDTERALGSLQTAAPVRMVDNPLGADLVFINTCAFIAPAVEESVRALVKCIDDIRGMPPKKRPLLVAAGCLVGRFGIGSLAPDLPEVDLFLDNRDIIGTWGEQLRRLLGVKEPRGGLSESFERLLSTGPSYAWLKISEGCRHACSFCTIPLIRGPLRSASAEVIAQEAKLLLGKGVKELIVVAQDVTAWGKDVSPKRNLPSLLERLLPLAGLERLRLMYLYPSGLTDDLLRFLREAGPPFVPYFDIPIQHAAASVLSRMGRPFALNPRAALDKVRSYFPEAALRTGVITGFPGETEQDFEELCRFAADVRFHHLGVFMYQAEEGTPAAVMDGQIAEEDKRRRRDTLMALQAAISEEILEEYVGDVMDVLVDAPHSEWPGLHTGRTWFQAPEVDGLTYVSGPGVRPGAMVRAEIAQATAYDLSALTEPLPKEAER